MSGGGRMTNMGWVPDEISFPAKQPTQPNSPDSAPSSAPASPQPSPAPTSTAPSDTQTGASGTSAPGGIVTGYDAAPNTPPGSTSCSGENPCPPSAPSPTPTPTYTSQPQDIKVKSGNAIRTFSYNSNTDRWEDNGDHLEPAGNGEYYIVPNDEPAKEKPSLWQRIKDRAKQKLRDAMGPDAYDMIFSTPQPSNE